jgi:hypothetical protein
MQKTKVVFLQKISADTGLPDGLFQTKNPNFGKNFWASDWKIFIKFMAIWTILRIFGIFYDHSVHFVFIWYIFSSFGIMHQEKSGNPAPTLNKENYVPSVLLRVFTIASKIYIEA